MTGRRSSVASLADSVRTGRRSAVALTRDSIARITAASELGAVVASRYESALEDADAIDRAVANGIDPGPLCGLPALIKDIEDAAGLPTRFGSLLFEQAPRAEKDGVIASRLRGQGAIIVGKSNVPEFAMEGYTSNRLYGTTRNPWANAFSPGGSSGGSAAALAAGLVAIATATDVGGSVRIPASLCGLVGLKPTTGLIGRDPILACQDLHTHGVIQSSACDVRIVFDAIRGPVNGDPGSSVWGPMPRSWRPRRIIAVNRMLDGPQPMADVLELFEGALAAIESELKIPVEVIEPARLFPSGIEQADYFRVVLADAAHNIGREVIESQRALFDPKIYSLLAKGLDVTVDEYIGAHKRRRRYGRELDQMLGDDALLASPTLVVDGWLTDGRLPGVEGDPAPGFMGDNGIVNLTGHPAISVPAGRHQNGVPMGLQLVAPRFADETLLRFAEDWEAIRPWPLTAEGYDPI